MDPGRSPFTPREPPAADIGAFATWAAGVGPYRYQARFTMYAPAHRVAERVPAAAGTVEAIDADTSVLLAGSNSLDGMAMHVTLLGFDFTVHEPPELVEHFRLLHGRMGRAIEDQPAVQPPSTARTWPVT